MRPIHIIPAALLLLAGCTGMNDQEGRPLPGESTPPRFESCELTDEPCIKDCELTEYYYAIWQSQFKRVSGMSDEYYDRHITVGRYFLHENSQGTGTFHIDYRVTIGWARICASDHITTKLSPNTNEYAYLNLRRGVNFNEAEIDANVKRNVGLASITTVNPIDSLPYASLDAAVAAFRAKTGYPQLYPARLTYYVPGRIPRVDGDPYLIGSGTIDLKRNLCVEGNFNLHSGNATAKTDACFVE